MWKKTWDWTKFIALMLCVGVMPFALDFPAPLILALVAVAMVAATAVAVQHTRAVFSCIPAAVSVSYPASDVASPEYFSLPEDPGTPGTMRSRAPSLFSAARG